MSASESKSKCALREILYSDIGGAGGPLAAIGIWKPVLAVGARGGLSLRDARSRGRGGRAAPTRE